MVIDQIPVEDKEKLLNCIIEGHVIFDLLEENICKIIGILLNFASDKKSLRNLKLNYFKFLDDSLDIIGHISVSYVDNTMYLLNWIKKHFPIRLKRFIKQDGGFFIRDALQWGSGSNIKMIEFILNFMSGNSGVEEKWEKFILNYRRSNGVNMLAISLKNQYPDVAQCLWDWMKVNLKFETLKEVIRKAYVENEINESALSIAIRNHTEENKGMAKLILEYIVEKVQNNDERKAFLLEHCRSDNAKILNCSINENWNMTFLWEFIKEGRLESNAVKASERVKNDDVGESAILNAAKNDVLSKNVKLECIKNIINDMKNNHGVSNTALNELVLENSKKSGENILSYALQSADSKFAQILMEWLNEEFGTKTVKALIKKGKEINGQIIESALFAAIRNEHWDRFQYGFLLNFIKKHFSSDELELRSILLSNNKDEGRNILYYSFAHNDTYTIDKLLNWIKGEFGIETVKDLIKKGRVENDRNESALFAAFRRAHSDCERCFPPVSSILRRKPEILSLTYRCKYKVIELILNFMMENQFKEFILENSKVDGSNILTCLIRDDFEEGILFKFSPIKYDSRWMWNWIVDLLGHDALKQLIKEGKVKNGVTMESALFAVIRNPNISEKIKLIELILDFMKSNPSSDDDELETLILENSKDDGRNVLILSLRNNDLDITLYLWKWIVNNFPPDRSIVILQKLIRKTTVRNDIIQSSLFTEFRNLEKVRYENEELSELMLNFINKHMGAEFREFILTNSEHDGRNILTFLIRKDRLFLRPMYLFSWIEANLEPDTLIKLIKEGIKKGEIIESTLFTELRDDRKYGYDEYDAIFDNDMVYLILNFMKKNASPGELEKFICEHSTDDGTNIFTCSILETSTNPCNLLSWVIDNVGEDAARKLIEYGKVRRNGEDIEIIESALFTVFQNNFCAEIVPFLLDKMKKLYTSEKLKKFILANVQDNGENILLRSLKRSQIYKARHLLKWVNKNCGSDTLKLLLNGKVLNDNRISTTLHRALATSEEYFCGLILNFVEDHIDDKDFLKDFVLGNHINTNEYFPYFSKMSNDYYKGTLYLIEWVIENENLGVDVLKELILKKRLGNFDTVRSLFKKIKEDDTDIEIIAESMLQFISENETQLV